MSKPEPMPSFAAMRAHHRRVEAMIADPDCKGDLLLMGLAIARWVDYGLPAKKPNEKITWKGLGEQVLQPGRGSGRIYVKETLRNDIRRYDPIEDLDSHFFRSRCGAPMIRRQGPCGASASRQVMVTDPETGRKSWLSGCSRHTEWFEAQRIKSRDDEPARRPFANAGGVLARHIPDIDWPHIYRQIDPSWTAPPEGDYEDDDLVIERPKLRLILGGAS